MEFKIIPTDKIRPNPFQPRESFSKEEIEELAESIKGTGLVQPIMVRRKGEIYEIVAGERRWRASQFAKLKEIPAIVREADDLETRELSLIENWHRLALQPIEAEKFVAKLYEDGVKAGRYKGINDMSRKTGIPNQTLSDLISSHKEREELGLSATVTYTDITATRVLKDEPKLRKQLLTLREKGKLSRDELREYARVARRVSEPVRRALLKEDSKLTPEEALVIDAELIAPEEKIRAIEEIERERTPERVRRLVRIIREIGETRKEIEVVKAVDTGDVWICPICSKKFHLLHVDPGGTHRFEEVVE